MLTAGSQLSQGSLQSMRKYTVFSCDWLLETDVPFRVEAQRKLKHVGGSRKL